MPDNSARYRRWVQRLTLKQYILFMGVVNFAVGTVVAAVTSSITEPFSWVGVAAWTVLMTAFLPGGDGVTSRKAMNIRRVRAMTRRDLNLTQLVCA
jgi:hypothetical protein